MAGLGFGSTQQKKVSKQAACPCGSGAAYQACCGRYHSAAAAAGGAAELLLLPPTAEALMRSRFSAYAKGHVAYICETTHPDNPLLRGEPRADGEPPASSSSTQLAEDVRATCENISWDKLKVLGGWSSAGGVAAGGGVCCGGVSTAASSRCGRVGGGIPSVVVYGGARWAMHVASLAAVCPTQGVWACVCRAA